MHGKFESGPAYPWTIQPHDIAGPKDTWKWRAYNCETGAQFIAATHSEVVAHTQASAGKAVRTTMGEKSNA
jgi:hypothetical protein